MFTHTYLVDLMHTFQDYCREKASATVRLEDLHLVITFAAI